MGKYLEVTNGRLANKNKSEWEKEIAGRMTCTNNGAESPFATVRAFLEIYPRSTLTLTLTLTLILTLTLTLSLPVPQLETTRGSNSITNHDERYTSASPQSWQALSAGWSGFDRTS